MSFLDELKRRKVFRLAIAYVVVAWLIMQVIDVINEPLSLPDWFDTVVIVFLGLMFPIALMLSWAYDVTPDGVVTDEGEKVSASGIDYGKIALGAVIVLGAFLAGNYLTDSRGPSVSAPTQSGLASLRRFQFSVDGPFETDQLVSTSMAITPDGQRVVYRVGDVGAGQLVSRSMDQLEFALISGTENARAFFAMSPDGRWLVFQDDSDGVLKKVPIEGGPSRDIVDPGGGIRDLAWSPDGHIVYGVGTVGNLMRVPDTGGTPFALANPPDGETYKHPAFLPGTDLMLVSTGERGLSPNGEDELAFLLPDGDIRKTGITGSSPRATVDGRLLYFNQSVIWTASFDTEGLSIAPDPVAVASDVEYAFQAVYAVSEDASLVYRLPRNRVRHEIVAVDRAGSEDVLPLPPGTYGDLSPAPDGRRLAAVNHSEGGPDLWVYSVDGSESIRITRDESIERGPTWGPDGRYLYFSSGRIDDVYRYDVDSMGEPERLTEAQQFIQPRSVSPDGATVFVTATDVAGATGGSPDIAMINVDAGSELDYILTTASSDFFPTISPNGRRLAYQSDRLGRNEIFIGEYPNLSTTDTRISTGGGTQPAWSADSAELFYWGDTHIMAATVDSGDEILINPPTALFSHQSYNSSNYSTYVLPPNKFLFARIESGDGGTTNEFIYVQNWPVLLNDASATP